MSLKTLVHPAQVCFPLAANASNTTFELSTANADILDAYRLAMGGSVRILIASPATVDYTTPYFETAEITATHTSGVFTVSAMTNEAEYTTANNACIFLNLIADGSMEWYNIGAWTESNFTGFKTTESKIGVQGLRGKASASPGYVKQLATVVDDENYYFSAWTKVISGDSSQFIIYDETGAANILAFTAKTNTSWNRVFGSFALPASCVSLSTRLELVTDTDEGWFDNCLLLPNIIPEPGFETISGWTGTNGTLALDSSEERTGTNCGKLTATADGGYVGRSITVTDDTWYTFGFNAKGSADGHRFKFQVVGVTTSTVYYDSGYINSYSSYMERLCTIKTNGDTSLSIRGVVETSGEIVYFDDFYGMPLIVKDPTTETPSTESYHYSDARW